jgi:chemotaxis signal transduction protein
MTTMVCFQSAGVAYCLPVQATRAVRPASGMTALPAPKPDVAGILPGKPPLTIICPLGTTGGYIMIIEAANTTFGLLVDHVTGLRQVADADISGAPVGQDDPLVSGTIDTGSQTILVADPNALAGRL